MTSARYTMWPRRWGKDCALKHPALLVLSLTADRTRWEWDGEALVAEVRKARWSRIDLAWAVFFALWAGANAAAALHSARDGSWLQAAFFAALVGVGVPYARKAWLEARP